MQRLLKFFTAAAAALAVGVTLLPVSAQGSCAFGTRLHTSGQSIVDSSGCVVASPSMPWKGMDVQVGNPPNYGGTDYQAMANEGVKYVRLVVKWDFLEPTKGNISSTYLSDIAGQVADAKAANLYTYVSLYWTQNPPSWLATDCGTSNMAAQYEKCGQTVTQALASEFASDPTVMGMGMNETSAASGSSVNVNIETEYNQMISWMRAKSPSWIGWVQSGSYGSGTPIYNDPNAGWTGSQDSYTDTNLSKYPGNVIVTVHDYRLGFIPKGSTPPSGTKACPNNPCDGRNAGGGVYNVTNGGWDISQADSELKSVYQTYPVTYDTRTQAQAYMHAFLAPVLDLGAGVVGTNTLKAPVDVEEFGVNNSVPASYRCAWMSDLMAGMNPATGPGATAASPWDYSHSSSDPYATSPGGVGTWRREINLWLQGSCSGS